MAIEIVSSTMKIGDVPTVMSNYQRLNITKTAGNQWENSRKTIHKYWDLHILLFDRKDMRLDSKKS